MPHLLVMLGHPRDGGGLKTEPERDAAGVPGGQLIFLVNSVLLMLTVPDAGDQPATERMLRPYFGMHRFEWPDDLRHEVARGE